MEEMMNTPLQGVKIVEYGTGFAAPGAARILSYLGADVIKVEAPAGDPLRKAGPRYVTEEADGCSKALFAAANAGKRFMVLDLETEKDLFEKLISTADAFITDLPRAELSRLGIDEESLRARFPKLVYGYVSGYGTEGPMADAPWSDATAYFARGGYMVDYVAPGSDPANRVWGAGECNTSLALANGVMAGILKAMMQGEGSYVKASLLHTSTWVASMNYILSPYGRAFEEPFHRTKDGIYMFVQAVTEKQKAGLLSVLGIPAEEYNQRRKVLPKLREMYAQKTFQEWADILGPLNLPYERMRHISELAEDPQALANNFILRTEVDGKTISIAMPPITYAGAPDSLNCDCSLGKDDAAIRAELAAL